MNSNCSCIFGKVFYFVQKSLISIPIGVHIAIIIGLLTLYIVWKSKSSKTKTLTEEEKDAIIEQWTPEPLVSAVPDNHPALKTRLITQSVGKRIVVNGHDCLNMASHNYLGLLSDREIQDSAIASVHKYGVGSCGPRGFYGTIDVHLELEERIAKFMELEESIVYSYGFSTIASAISAYCKRNDIIFVDEYVNFSIQKGLDASRSRVIYFKHNDMADLERLLRVQDAFDKRNPKKASRIRRFLIVEAIYMNTGEMCPLNELVELRKKYKLRLILDEGVSFGTIGQNGRGLTEFLNVDRQEVDLICSSLENAVASIGGFTVGSTFIVDHQRLSGLGYCFSASAPPLLAQAAICALDRFESNRNMFKELNDCSTKLDKKLRNLTKLELRGHALSPVKHLYLKDVEREHEIEQKTLNEIVDQCMEQKLALVCAEYLQQVETNCPRASIRITANRLLTDADIDFVYETIERVSTAVLGN